MRWTLMMWLCAGAAWAQAPQEQAQEDSLSSGLTTISMMDDDPPGFRVSWIKWDSGFRGTDLRIGDRIIGVNGKRIAKAKDMRDLQLITQSSIGYYAEAAVWKAAGAKEGAPLTLT